MSYHKLKCNCPICLDSQKVIFNLFDNYYSNPKQLEWLDKRLNHGGKIISLDYELVCDISINDLELMCKSFGYTYKITKEKGYRNNKYYDVINFYKKEESKEYGPI